MPRKYFKILVDILKLGYETYLENQIFLVYIMYSIDDPTHRAILQGSKCCVNPDNIRQTSIDLSGNFIDNVTPGAKPKALGFKCLRRM